MATIKKWFRERRVQLSVAMVIVSAVVAIYGTYRTLAYTVPMYTGNYLSAAESGAGDESFALYNLGLQAFEAKEYDAAKEIFTKGYSKLTETEAGTINSDSKKKLGAELQFMLGNTALRQKQVKVAIEAYKAALRLNPNHLAAKYNLELLQSNSGGAGGAGGDSQKDPSGGSNRDPKKGI